MNKIQLQAANQIKLQQISLQSHQSILSSIQDNNQPSNSDIQYNDKSHHYRLAQFLKQKNSLPRHQEEQEVKDLQPILIRPSQVDVHPEPDRCKICLFEQKTDPNTFLTPCEHKYSFCLSCLQQYTLCRVNQFQEVTCPQSSCTAKIEFELTFFKGLPQDIQHKCRKIHKFYSNLNDPNAKMCPKENCEGILKKQQKDNSLVCGVCLGDFCNCCLMAKHIGQCEEFQLIFLEKILGYKRCGGCGMMVQRKEGCNHIKCLCGCQFCYFCGKLWTTDHFNAHNGGQQILQQEEIQMEQNKSSLTVCWEWFISIVLFIPKSILTLVMIMGISLYFMMLIVTLVGCSCCLLVSDQSCKTFSRLFRLGFKMGRMMMSIWDV